MMLISLKYKNFPLKKASSSANANYKTLLGTDQNANPIANTLAHAGVKWVCLASFPHTTHSLSVSTYPKSHGVSFSAFQGHNSLTPELQQVCLFCASTYTTCL